MARSFSRWFVLLAPAPALLLIFVILIGSDQVWVVRTMTRYARPGSTFGALSLFAVALLCPLYYLAPRLTGALAFSRGVRPPTQAELGCAGFLLRALILAGIYVVAYGLVSRFG